MAKRFKIALNVDERTESMSPEALNCRAWGHKWEVRNLSRRRILELLELGLYERNRYCANGCQCTWRQVYEIGTGQLVENERTYPANGEYLAPKGQGRVKRSDALPGFFAREFAEFL